MCGHVCSGDASWITEELARAWARDLEARGLHKLGGVFVWAAAKRVDATERDAFLRLVPFRQIIIYDPFHDGAVANVNADQSATICTFALGTGSPEQITDELMAAAGFRRDLASPAAQRRTIQTVSLSRDLEMRGLGKEACLVFFVSGVHENMLRSLIAGIEFERTFITSLFLSDSRWLKSVGSQMEVRNFLLFNVDGGTSQSSTLFVKNDLENSWWASSGNVDADACDLRVTILEPCATCLIDGPGLPFRLVLRVDLLQRTSDAHPAHADGDGSDDSRTTEVIVLVRLHGELVVEIVQPITSTSTTIEAWVAPLHRTIEHELKLNCLMDRNLRVDALSECRGLAVSAERVIRQVPSHAFFVHAGLDPDQWPPNEPAIAGGAGGTAEEANRDAKTCLLGKGGRAVALRETVVMEEDCEDYSIECMPGVHATLQLHGLPNELGSPRHLFSGTFRLPASMCALIVQSPVPLHLHWQVRPRASCACIRSAELLWMLPM